jgi:hypothetical protein
VLVNVTDDEANAWFDLMPPAGYAEIIYKHIQTQSRQYAAALEKWRNRADLVSSYQTDNNAVLQPV